MIRRLQEKRSPGTCDELRLSARHVAVTVVLLRPHLGRGALAGASPPTRSSAGPRVGTRSFRRGHPESGDEQGLGPGRAGRAASSWPWSAPRTRACPRFESVSFLRGPFPGPPPGVLPALAPQSLRCAFGCGLPLIPPAWCLRTRVSDTMEKSQLLLL